MALSATKVNLHQSLAFMDWESGQGKGRTDYENDWTIWSAKHCHKNMVFKEWRMEGGVWRAVWWVGRCGLCRKAYPFTCGHAHCLPQQLEYPNWQGMPRSNNRMKFYVDPRPQGDRNEFFAE